MSIMLKIFAIPCIICLFVLYVLAFCAFISIGIKKDYFYKFLKCALYGMVLTMILVALLLISVVIQYV